MTKCLANAVISELVRIMITYVRQRLQCRFYSVREQFEDFLSMSLLSPRPCYLARFCMGFFRKTTIITIKVVTYTTDGFIYFFLDSSFVIGGFITDSKKISVAFSYILHHSIFCDSLSSDNIACSKRSAGQTKSPINGAIVTAERKKSEARVRVKNNVQPARPEPTWTRPDQTRLKPPLFFLSTATIVPCTIFALFY